MKTCLGNPETGLPGCQGRQLLLLIVKFGRVAQLVEQWTENPCVGGSNPPPTTSLPIPQTDFTVWLGFYSVGQLLDF